MCVSVTMSEVAFIIYVRAQNFLSQNALKYVFSVMKMRPPFLSVSHAPESASSLFPIVLENALVFLLSLFVAK